MDSVREFFMRLIINNKLKDNNKLIKLIYKISESDDTFSRDKFINNISFLEKEINQIKYKIEIVTINKNSEKVIILFPGKCDCYFSYELIEKISEMFNITVVTFNYPGYQMSEPNLKNETNFYNSGKIVVDHFREKYSDIFLIGICLGTSVVVDYLYNNLDFKCQALLVCLIESLPKLCTGKIDIDISHFMIGHHFDNRKKLPYLNQEIHVLHCIEDDFLTVEQSKEMYELINSEKTITFFNGTGHDFTVKNWDVGFELLREKINK